MTKFKTDPSWIRLPYPISGTTFTHDLLTTGNWYRHRVVPVNGFNEGSPSRPVETRTVGRPFLDYDEHDALGDSYSAGIGAGGSDGYTGGDCRRTTKAWPYHVAPFDSPVISHKACTGATTWEMWESQLPDVFHDYDEEGLVTLTIGGNDVGFGDVLQKCIKDSESCASLESVIAERIDNLKPVLVETYSDIRAQVPGADIVAAGYPKLIEPPGSGDCNVLINMQITDDEKYMVLRLGARLNAVIKDAARLAGVIEAVDETVARFDGHAACSTNGEYINQTAGGAIPVDFDGSFHPNEAGHVAYGAAVNDRLSALFNKGAKR